MTAAGAGLKKDGDDGGGEIGEPSGQRGEVRGGRGYALDDGNDDMEDDADGRDRDDDDDSISVCAPRPSNSRLASLTSQATGCSCVERAMGPHRALVGAAAARGATMIRWLALHARRLRALEEFPSAKPRSGKSPQPIASFSYMRM